MSSTNIQKKASSPSRSPKKATQSNFNLNRKLKSDLTLQEESEEEDDILDDDWYSDSTISENDEEFNGRLIMYSAYTQYDVIKEVAKNTYNFHLTKNEQRDFDIAWFDGPISIRLLQRMWPYQRTNHFPGMYNLARKNCLGKHLVRMQKWFPDEYNFFPQTFMLPIDYKEFKAQITVKRNKTFIVKPEASCQGKGIFLTRNFEDVDPDQHYVIQRYMHKPYLVDSYKFDLRLYIMLAGVNPLRIYLYKEGLARFATVPYESPQPSNLSNLFMHLTNYAINKESENFVQNSNENEDDVGSKRSFTSILKRIQEEFGEDRVLEVMDNIKDIIIKTLCIAQPHLQHLYRSCQPDDIENSMCFQILGFDIMLDEKLKPSLLEVNQSPSFSTDSPLDYKIKKSLITDTIRLLNLSVKRRIKAKNLKKAQMQKRLFKSNVQQAPSIEKNEPKDNSKRNAAQVVKSSQIDKEKTQNQVQVLAQANAQSKPKIQIYKTNNQEQAKLNKQEEKEEMRKKKMLSRDQQESELYGNYMLIYPLIGHQEEWQIIEEEKKQQSRENSPKKSQQQQQQQAQPQTSLFQPKLKQQDSKEEEKTLRVSSGESQETTSDDNQCNKAPVYVHPYERQKEYMKFMEKAKELWESFTNGNQLKKIKQREQQREQELKQQEDEKQRREKQKQRLLERMRKNQEERKLKVEVPHSYRQNDGLDEEGNLISQFDYSQAHKYYLDKQQQQLTYSARYNDYPNLENQYKNQDLLSPTTNPNPYIHFFDNRKLMNEFHLPKVHKQKHISLKNVANVRTLSESLDKNYNHYNFVKDGASVPAVPALYQHAKDIPMSYSPQKQRNQGLTSQESWNKLGRPPLNKTQMLGQKKEDNSINDTFLRSRIQMQSQAMKIQEVVQVQQQSQGVIQSKGNFAIGTTLNKIPNQNEQRIGGLSKYNLNHKIVDFQKRSASQDLKEENKYQRNHHVNSLLIQVNKQNPIISSVSRKKGSLKRKEISNSQSSYNDIINMGIIGEKKALQGTSYQIIEQNASIPQQKQHRVLKIKEQSMKLQYNDIFKTQGLHMHQSNSQKHF